MVVVWKIGWGQNLRRKICWKVRNVNIFRDMDGAEAIILSKLTQGQKIKRSMFSRGENPSLLKTQNLVGHGGVSHLLQRLRQENRWNPGDGGCSELGSCRCTPAWATRVKVSQKSEQASNF